MCAGFVSEQVVGNIILNEAKLICLHRVKLFQVLLFTTNSSICVELNSFKYCCQTLIIQFNINHLLAHS